MTDAPGMAIDAAERVVAVCDVLAGLIPDDVDRVAEDVRTEWAVEMGLIPHRGGDRSDLRGGLRQFPDQPWRQLGAMRSFAGHSTTISIRAGVADGHPRCATPA